MTTPATFPPFPDVSDEYRASLLELARAELAEHDDDDDNYSRHSADYVRAVLEVARLLDVARPGWFRELDLDDLNMDSMDDCVLGQLYADFARPDGHDTGFSYGFATLIRSRYIRNPELQLGVCSIAPRSVWLAEVARRVELAEPTGES